MAEGVRVSVGDGVSEVVAEDDNVTVREAVVEADEDNVDDRDWLLVDDDVSDKVVVVLRVAALLPVIVADSVTEGVKVGERENEDDSVADKEPEIVEPGLGDADAVKDIVLVVLAVIVTERES